MNVSRGDMDHVGLLLVLAFALYLALVMSTMHLP